jgi:Spy/CpxP family protein refolding chaperone
MGFVLGVLFVLGMFVLFKGAAWRRGGWGHGHHHHHPRRHRYGWGRIKQHLKVDEDQEGIVDLALTDLRRAVTGLREALMDGRGEIARAFRGDRVDDAALDAVFARQDEDLARARREAVSALRQIHAVLEPEQREAAVTWLGAREHRYV